jgi:sialate O-acetylesterase
LYVQLANYKERTEDPGARTQIAPLRAAQTAALRVPHTGMAVAIDLGDAKDIHPKNKQEIGHRLALIARAKVYRETDLPYSGPMLVSARPAGSAVRLEFAHTHQGLVAKGAELKGFAIAGDDGAFKWAKASIDGNTVIVSSDEVTEPRHVRYAWADNPESTLYNGAGLPCAPFATTVAR